MQYDAHKALMYVDGLGDVDTVSYTLPGELIISPIENDDSFLVGSDYCTVLVTDNKKDVLAFIDRITPEMFLQLVDEYDYDSILTFELDGLFVISCEIGQFDDHMRNWIYKTFVVAGAEADDVDLHTTVRAIQYKINNNLSFDELNEKYGDGEFESDEELDCSVDSALRLYEYSDLSENRLNDILKSVLVLGGIA